MLSRGNNSRKGGSDLDLWFTGLLLSNCTVLVFAREQTLEAPIDTWCGFGPY